MRIATIAATAALGGLLFGYNTGIIAGTLLFLQASFHLSSLMLGVLTSIALAGAAIGAAVVGMLADRFGRRRALIGTALVFIVGAAISALASNVADLLGGRLLVGFGIGAASMLTPLYLSEIALARQRGMLVSFNQLAMTSGILLSNLVGYGFAATAGWRWMFALGGLPGVALAVGMLFLPETPRWLAGHDQVRVRSALRRLRGAQADIEAEWLQLRTEIALDGQQRPHPFRSPDARRPLMIGVGLAILQQATGINTVVYFAPVIFQSAGLSSASAAILATAGIGLVNVLMTIVAIRLVDRVGRRPLLLSGLAGMAVSLCMLAIGFTLRPGPAVGWMTAASLSAYVGCFAIGLGPVFWLLISEIFPLGVRARGMSVATTANWLANLVVALTFLAMLTLLGRPCVFLIYAALAFGALLFAWALVPETKGLSLGALAALWAGR